MQVQEKNGRYDKPEKLDLMELADTLERSNIKRVIVFPAYGEAGKPTPELRRAWRRWQRTRR